MDFKVGDKVDFLWGFAHEDNYADFGKIVSIYEDIAICRPYRSRNLLQCNLSEIKHSKRPKQHENN